jgi:hypothetical protein
MPAQTYVALVRPLPRPQPAQVERFVHHVADAENWLKGAAFEDGAAVTVFLDPNAGLRVNRRSDGGGFELERLDPGAELLHGSELPTETYRASCGFLAYHAELGAGTAAVDDGLARRARLPEPGIVEDGAFVPLPAALRVLACRPGALLHGTFRRPTDAGEMRRFRFAVERLPRLEPRPPGHPLLERIEAWRRRCQSEDDLGFAAWLRASQGEEPAALDEPGRWRRYVEWRDAGECMALHRAQDAAFAASGILNEVVRLHEAALHQLRDTTQRMLHTLDALPG